MGEEAADLDWRRFLSAWERCKAEKGGRATKETFSNKFISYNKWNPSSNMRIICVQTVVPGYTFDWVGIYAKFKEVSQCAAPLLWPCMNFTAQKRINTEQVFNIVISSLTKIFTNKMYHFMLHLLLDWMTTGQPHSRPPRRDPPCNCCPKPCQQFLLSQRYGPQNLSIFVVVFYITFRFFNGKLLMLAKIVVLGLHCKCKEFDFNFFISYL